MTESELSARVSMMENLRQEVLSPGGVDRLVSSGRIISVIPKRSTSPESGLWEKNFMLRIPPEGVQIGDSYKYIKDGRCEFYSPQGVLRGESELVGVTHEEGEVVKQRVRRALERRETIWMRADRINQITAYNKANPSELFG